MQLRASETERAQDKPTKSSYRVLNYSKIISKHSKISKCKVENKSNKASIEYLQMNQALSIKIIAKIL
jgi:hypothetical protein